MKPTLTKLLLLLAFVAMLWVATGCQEPENASTRPWNSSEGYEGGMLNGMNYQHE